MIYHEQTNVFPNEIKDCGTCEKVDDYRNFLLNIAEKIIYYSNNLIPVFFKGYKQKVKEIWRSDAYDREVMKSLMKKYSIDCHTNSLIDVNDCFPNFWMKPTHSQKGQRTDNQSWMNNARKIQRNYGLKSIEEYNLTMKLKYRLRNHLINIALLR